MQGPRLVKNGVRCIVADSGYRDKGRAAAYVMDTGTNALRNINA